MVDIPEDLRHLRDFPTYDTTFQDGPKFRQNLQYWTFKTEKLALTLTSLADSFEHFHTSGLEHYKAAIQLVQGLQEIATQWDGNTIAGPLQQFSDSLNRIWCYYESFLGQTQLLNVEPLRELANMFNNLKRLNEELMHYRKEFISAAEKLCAYRNVSKLVDKSAFASLSEACYTAQKTYRLVLSKYVVSLRQAHTQDMISLVRRVIEHMLSLYSYCNFSAQVLKELEPSVNELFTKTKNWQTFYEEELKVWGRLHHSVQRHILAEFQLYVGLTPSQHTQQPTETTTWFEFANTAAMAPINVGKRMLKILPSTGSPQKDYKPQTSPSPDWFVVGPGGEEEGLDFSTRRQTVSTVLSEEKQQPVKLPAARTQSTSVLDPDSVERHKKRRHRRKLVKSISDPEILSSLGKDGANGTVPDGIGGPRGGGEVEMRDKLSVSSPPVVRHSQDTTESAANAIEELLNQSSPTSTRSSSLSASISAPFRPLAAILGRPRRKHKNKNAKKQRKVSTSAQELSTAAPDESLPQELSTAEEHSMRAQHEPSPPVPSTQHPSPPAPSTQHSSPPAPSTQHPSPPAPSTQHPSTPAPEEPSIIVERDDSSEDLVFSSPSEEQGDNVSSPVQREGVARSESAHLHSLVLPVPKGWSQCGYLWLRMKLPNNRYAWTFIYCVVDRTLGQLMIQEQGLPEPRRLENLMLCTTKLCTPDFIDRNYCFRVISPSSEHLFQTLNEQDLHFWMDALQKTTAEALQKFETCPQALPVQQEGGGEGGGTTDIVSDAMALILAVPGNRQCADCTSTDVEWASINLGIALCITCSGVHRSLGVHVSKVRSLNLDNWDSTTVEFMQSQGNTKSNSYYEAMLGKGAYTDVRRPAANANKEERGQFIRQKYVSLTFVPENDDRSTPL